MKANRKWCESRKKENTGNGSSNATNQKKRKFQNRKANLGVGGVGAGQTPNQIMKPGPDSIKKFFGVNLHSFCSLDRFRGTGKMSYHL
jgi:hypothetical protein